MEKTPIPHSKTFTGCWTCRARHVKCDEERPHCFRCRNRQVACEGYGVRLVWDGDSDGTNRTSLSALQYTPVSNLNQFELVKAIEDLDEAPPTNVHETRQRGPFAVFTVNPRHDAAVPCTVLNNASPPECTFPAVGEVPRSSTSRPEPAQMNFDEALPAIPNEASSNLTKNEISSAPSLSMDIQSASASSLTLTSSPSWRPPSFQSSDMVLMHHWITFVSINCVLIDILDNPFRTILTPMAVQFNPDEPSAQAALYHSICAAAAYSRGRLCPSPSSDLLAAAKHDSLAIQHLHSSLASNAPNQKEALLAAIMMLSMGEIIKGSLGTWRQHLLGGKGWIESFGASAWEAPQPSSVLYQQFQGALALASLQNPSQSCFNCDAIAEGDYCLENIFGLPRKMLLVLMRLKQICCSTTETTPEELNAFELELYLSVPSSADPALDKYGEPSRMVYLHMAHVFYYAALIFFKRKVRQIPPQDLQDLVSKCIEHLESMEDIPRVVQGAPVTWPCLVAASEATDPALKQRFATWFRRKQRHGFGLADVAACIAFEVWRVRDAQQLEDEVDWMDVMSQMGYDVLLC